MPGTALLSMADGDGRYLLGMVEQVLAAQDAGGPEPLDVDGLRGVIASRAPLYDKSREEHYNLISALHKSMRGSDPDAALYWLARMLGGARTRSTWRAVWCDSPARTSAWLTPPPSR